MIAYTNLGLYIQPGLSEVLTAKRWVLLRYRQKYRKYGKMAIADIKSQYCSYKGLLRYVTCTKTDV